MSKKNSMQIAGSKIGDLKFTKNLPRNFIENIFSKRKNHLRFLNSHFQIKVNFFVDSC